MRTMAERKRALLDILSTYEEMSMLFTSLARSPALWGDDADDDACETQDKLVAEGDLVLDGNFVTTTAKGRARLVAYIEGEVAEEDFSDFADDEGFDDEDSDEWPGTN